MILSDFILVKLGVHDSFSLFLIHLFVVDGLVVLPLMRVLEVITDLFFALLIVHLLVFTSLVFEELLLFRGTVNCLFTFLADPIVSILVTGLLNKVLGLFLHLLVHLHLLRGACLVSNAILHFASILLWPIDSRFVLLILMISPFLLHLVLMRILELEIVQ